MDSSHTTSTVTGDDCGFVDRLLGPKSAKAAKLLLTLSKSGWLAVSAAWVLIDFRLLIDSASGEGSLVLGSIASAASLLMLLVDFGIWLHLPLQFMISSDGFCKTRRAGLFTCTLASDI